MSSIITYNQVVDILKDIAQRHFQINSFYLGRDWELENDDDIIYPLFQVFPESARMPVTNGEYKTIEMRLICKVVDLVKQDESNEKDVHSDCLRIAQDIINEFNQHPFYIRSNASLTGDINITSLEEFEDDFTAGWEFGLTLKLININSYCGLPFEEITGYSANGPISTGYSQSVQYLTCSSVAECESVSNLIHAIILTSTTQGNYLPLSGGIVTGETIFNQGLSASTFSAGTIAIAASIGENANSAQTINWNLSDQFTYTLTSNTTFNFSNATNGRTINLAVSQNATISGYTLNWPATVKWPYNISPVQTAAINTTDIYSIVQINGVQYGNYSQNYI